ncbi:hypothetical protein PhiH1_380 [Halobacterium phage phiH]|jgi:hypothetical protein|uniref:Uncharacterized protein n=1 Tax=Halobacterium phage phiH TaxID=169684 RepID=A0A3G1ZKV7_BPPHH|nr:hypothetical protein JR051_gp77 [Halobacterium phage phiH]AYM00322.1 hypothetical protein PhiH1_380 [Halobacterium phage phiH]
MLRRFIDAVYDGLLGMDESETETENHDTESYE